MENIKVRVNNEAESKEVQELFFELWCGWPSSGVNYKDISCPQYIFCIGNILKHGTKPYYSRNPPTKEITLPQLRDLVVLKRNCIEDATHIRGDGKLYFHAKSTDYYYQFSKDDEWLLSTWMNYQLLPQLKPIEKHMQNILDTGRHTMKEFLVFLDDKWTLQLLDADTEENSFRVAVPIGAEVATKSGQDKVNFWKADGEFWWSKSSKKWEKQNDLKYHLDNFGHSLVWQRHTQPEELPFVGDDVVNHPSHYASSNIECVDAMEAMMTPEQFIGYLRGNVFKYQWRYEEKNGLEDVKKAQWYLNRLINQLEK